MERPIQLPSEVCGILYALQNNGYSAWAVGGCVRDSLLGIPPKDWDICSAATPRQVTQVFGAPNVRDTGSKYGTVTVLRDGTGYEVTTLRCDGNYSDGRRPDSVIFTDDIEQDLARRDFTINAMACTAAGEIVDPFGGRQDLANGTIKCVGDPGQRFKEDALRILRALRFASTYGFFIELETEIALRENVMLLRNVAQERIYSELCKIVCAPYPTGQLLRFSDVFTVILPELAPCVGFDQKNKYHAYNVYDHIAWSVGLCRSRELPVRLALLLHDTGKPLCWTEDENGRHFHGHGVYSRDLAEQALTALKADNKTKHDVLELVLYHDAAIEPTPKAVRRWLSKIGEEQLRRLTYVREADILAHAPQTQESRLERCYALRAMIEQVVAEKQCFSYKDLAVNGKDLMDAGYKEGRELGAALKYLLDAVISGDLPNEKWILVNEAVRLLETSQE